LNLVKVMATFVEEVGDGAFRNTFNLRHVTLSPDVVIKPEAFSSCPSLAVLAASIGFELDTGDKDILSGGKNDHTVGITRFSKWRNQMVDNKEYYRTAMVMLELANTPLNGNGGMRATTEDPLWAFLAGPGRDLARLVLYFKLGVKVGKGNLGEASKAKLLEVGLELKMLRMENNRWNMGHRGVVVDEEGKVIEGGIREAVRRGLVIKGNHWVYLMARGLNEKGNRDVHDYDGIYGETRVVYGMLLNDVVVPVQEGLFADWGARLLGYEKISK